MKPSQFIPPWVKVVLATFLLLALYSIYGNCFFYRDPNGIFYDPDRAYERKYSLRREWEVNEFLKKASNDNFEVDTALTEGLSIDTKTTHRSYPICAAVVTFGDNRGGPRHPLEVFILNLGPLKRNLLIRA
jgi:hypothetical protein